MLLDEGAQDPRRVYPPPDPRRRAAASWTAGRATCAGLEWKSLQPWSADRPGNFRHLHQLFEGRVGADRLRGQGDGAAATRYYVAAKLNLGLIAKEWIPEEIEGVDRQAAHRDPRRGGATDRGRPGHPAPDAVPVRGVVRQDAVCVARAGHAAERRRAARAGRDRAPAGRAADPGVDGDHRASGWASSGWRCARSGARRS